MTELGKDTGPTRTTRRTFLGLVASAAGALLGRDSVSPKSAEAVKMIEGGSESPTLDIESLEPTPIREMGKYAVRIVGLGEDRSQARVVRLKSGEVGITIDIDPETILGAPFTHLEVYYTNGGGSINRGPNAKAYTDRYIPIQQVKSMLESQDEDLPEGDRRVRLLLVNRPLDKPYPNVLVIPETKIPTEDTLNTSEPWRIIDHGSEYVRIAGVTNLETPVIVRLSGGGLAMDHTEPRSFEIVFPESSGMGKGK